MVFSNFPPENPTTQSAKCDYSQVLFSQFVKRKKKKSSFPNSQTHKEYSRVVGIRNHVFAVGSCQFEAVSIKVFVVGFAQLLQTGVVAQVLEVDVRRCHLGRRQEFQNAWEMDKKQDQALSTLDSTRAAKKTRNRTTHCSNRTARDLAPFFFFFASSVCVFACKQFCFCRRPAKAGDWCSYDCTFSVLQSHIHTEIASILCSEWTNCGTKLGNWCEQA